MGRRRKLCAAALGFAALGAAPAYSLVAEPPARGFERALTVVPSKVAGLHTSMRFNLVGLHWRGARHARVEMRAHRAGGGWTGWAPVGHSDGIGRGGLTVSDPVWAGQADGIQLRSNSRLPGLVAAFQNTTGTATARDRAVTALRHDVTAVASPVLTIFHTGSAAASPAAPQIQPRSSWNDGSCRPRHAPEYGSVRMAFVHHTVTLNDYTPQDSPAIVLAICRYHVQQNGWNDIGYNFVADKYGQVFEGRAGGVESAVVGAQAQGWNSQSTGVSVLGTYTDTPLSEAGLGAVARLLAWKLSLHGVAPNARVTLTSPGGSENRWQAGSQVAFDTISGHRDGDRTSCPGDALYAQLPQIRALAAGEAAAIVKPRPHIATLLRGASRLRGSRYQARSGARLRAYARVTPMKRRLVFRAERRGTDFHWHTAARIVVRTHRGRAWATMRLRRIGIYRVRVLSFGDRRNRAGRSHPRIVEVVP